MGQDCSSLMDRSATVLLERVRWNPVGDLEGAKQKGGRFQAPVSVRRISKAVTTLIRAAATQSFSFRQKCIIESHTGLGWKGP